MIRCPICGVVIPEEDRDIVSPFNELLVAQIKCRSCSRVFTICEERRMLVVKVEGQPTHPENK